MKTSDIKRIGYKKVDHVRYGRDYKNLILEINFCGVSFFHPYKRGVLFEYSYRLAMLMVFRDIKRIFRGDKEEIALKGMFDNTIKWEIVKISEAANPLTDLAISDFSGLPFDFISYTEIEPGVYIFEKEEE